MAGSCFLFASTSVHMDLIAGSCILFESTSVYLDLTAQTYGWVLLPLCQYKCRVSASCPRNVARLCSHEFRSRHWKREDMYLTHSLSLSFPWTFTRDIAEDRTFIASTVWPYLFARFSLETLEKRGQLFDAHFEPICSLDFHSRHWRRGNIYLTHSLNLSVR